MIISPNLNIKILGYGKAVPDCASTHNVDILMLDPSLHKKDVSFLNKISDKVEAKFGVTKRYLTYKPWLKDTQTCETSEQLALKAVKCAIENQDKDKISLFIHGTTTTSRYTGSQATSVLGKIDVLAPAYEIKAGCSTSLASLHLATTMMIAAYPNVLISCAETLSKVMDPENKETWFGLADGGAAVWIEKNEVDPDFKILKSYYSTDGAYVDLFTTKGLLPPKLEEVKNNRFCLVGDKDKMKDISLDYYIKMLNLLFSEDISISEINWLIPHQVNKELIKEVVKSNNIEASIIWHANDYGNLGGSSVLFSLVSSLEKNVFKKGEKILLMSVGGGLSFAAQIWEKL